MTLLSAYMLTDSVCLCSFL